MIDALASHAGFRAYELVKVQASEQYAANCVRINDYVLIAAGYPEFERKLGNWATRQSRSRCRSFKRWTVG